MKNRLLFSTALVVVLSATNVYAADLTGKVERPDNINIGSSTEYTIDNAYSEQSGGLDEGTLYTSTVNVDKGGKLTVSSSDIVADGSGDAVTLKGTVILDGTSIMAGNKYPDAKQNMIIDGADITFNTTSDLLSATGDLKVSNASINASSLVADGEGDEEARHSAQGEPHRSGSRHLPDRHRRDHHAAAGEAGQGGHAPDRGDLPASGRFRQSLSAGGAEHKHLRNHCRYRNGSETSGKEFPYRSAVHYGKRMGRFHPDS